MDIVKGLDLAVNFRGGQFKVRQNEWGMMTFCGKHRWVFPLVPTACAYAKLNEYFGKLRDAENRSSTSYEESHGLVREEYQDDEESEEMLHGGAANKEARPIIKAEKEKKEIHAVGC